MKACRIADHPIKLRTQETFFKEALMTREYDEKRDFIRIDIDCEIVFKKVDSNDSAEEELTGQVSNLSGRGMMFISDVELEKDITLEINIKPTNILTPPLHANVKVVRVIKQRHADGYEIGAVIKEIYDEEE
jgi:hypothetical protein